MPLEDGADLVCDVIDERVDPVSVLPQIRHGYCGQWRNVFWLAGHAQVASDEVDMKGGPPRVTDERGNGKAYAAVVGHLSLELLERPAARGGQAPELVCERLPE